MLNSISLDELSRRIEEVYAFINRNAKKSAQTSAGKTSEFWDDIFLARGNFPNLNEFLVCRREGYSAGIDTWKLKSFEEEKAYNHQTYHQFRRFVPFDYVASIPESPLGAPYVFENEGIFRSAAFWVQSYTSFRVLDLVKRFGPSRPLRVLEIGAGLGICAYQLHLKGQIESYTNVDLPENLYLSTLYISSMLPDRKICFHEMDGRRIEKISAGTFNCCLPGTIECIGAKFDLIINSFSMQEMSLRNVRAYIDWIETVLSDDGIFVSINSHGKTDVKNPRDYRYEKFHIHHWGVFRQTPQSYFNTIPYEVVLGKRRPISPDYSADVQDVIGWLMQLGLDGDLRPFCAALTAGVLTNEQNTVLNLYHEFFLAKTDDEREALLRQLEAADTSAIFPFIKAHLHLARDQLSSCSELMKESCRRGLSDFARLRAEVIIATISRYEGISVPVRALDGLEIGIAYPEVEALVKSGNVDIFVGQANVFLNRPFARPLPRRIAGKLRRLIHG